MSIGLVHQGEQSSIYRCVPPNYPNLIQCLPCCLPSIKPSLPEYSIRMRDVTHYLSPSTNSVRDYLQRISSSRTQVPTKLLQTFDFMPLPVQPPNGHETRTEQRQNVLPMSARFRKSAFASRARTGLPVPDFYLDVVKANPSKIIDSKNYSRFAGSKIRSNDRSSPSGTAASGGRTVVDEGQAAVVCENAVQEYKNLYQPTIYPHVSEERARGAAPSRLPTSTVSFRSALPNRSAFAGSAILPRENLWVDRFKIKQDVNRFTKLLHYGAEHNHRWQ